MARLSKKAKKTALVAGVAVVAVAGGGAAAASIRDDGPGRSITGPALAKASAAALAETGAGQVTATEVDDEESWYEVEVTLPDGGQVDVQLNRDFGVVETKQDSEDGTSGAGDGSGTE